MVVLPTLDLVTLLQWMHKIVRELNCAGSEITSIGKVVFQSLMNFDSLLLLFNVDH